MKKKGAKRKGDSKADLGTASTSSASKNDDAIVDVGTQETQPSQEIEQKEAKVESPVPAEEGEIKEEVKEEQEEEQEDAKHDSATHQEKDQIVSPTDDATGASSSKKKSRGRKRKRSTIKKETENKEENIPSSSSRAKRARTTNLQDAKPGYFKEKRSLEDLWKAAFPVGTEWGQLDALYQSKWKFTNVEDALEVGGKLFGKTVYVFGCTESQTIYYSNETRDLLVPAVVCIESSIPPSDKIGVASVEGDIEEIIPMKDMKMDWVPYIPLDKRDRKVEKMKFQIYILGCTQRRAALKHLKEDRVKKFNYCLPYIDNPFKEDETKQSTLVQISFTSEVECEYDWAENNLEEFTDNLIKVETLPKEQKEEFMEFVQEQIDKSKTAYEKAKEAKEAREKAKEAMSEETKTAYKEMKFYKFYPLFSPATPDVANIKKSSFINKYFGEAHEVL